MRVETLSCKQSLWVDKPEGKYQKCTFNFAGWILECTDDGTPIKMYKKETHDS